MTDPAARHTATDPASNEPASNDLTSPDLTRNDLTSNDLAANEPASNDLAGNDLLEPNSGAERVSDMNPPHAADFPLITGEPLVGMRQRDGAVDPPDDSARRPAADASSRRVVDPPDFEVAVGDLAFEEFFREARDRIGKALALSIGDSHLAAEAVDEAMIRAYQQWDRVSSLDNPSAWVYRVGMNYCVSRFRRIARKVNDARRHLGDGVQHDTPFTDSIGDPRLSASLARLPIEQRAVVISRVLLGFSEADTASALGVRAGTVKSRLHRALAALRHDLAAEPPGTTRRAFQLPPITISNHKELS
ncbi:MAG TPA: SigE family RNA polymerase sigma factor [Ilumatobacter sp.]|nr:SigE family RNA polymerase sigma factor [Ilumatobacter sp.]